MRKRVRRKRQKGKRKPFEFPRWNYISKVMQPEWLVGNCRTQDELKRYREIDEKNKDPYYYPNVYAWKYGSWDEGKQEWIYG